MHVGGVSQGSIQIPLVHDSSLPEPSTDGLHLGVHRPVLKERHREDLTFYVVIEELVSLDQ